MGSDNGNDDRKKKTLSSIPHSIQKDEKKTMISNMIGIPMTLSLHYWVSSPWIPATVVAVAMNLTYVEASIKAAGWGSSKLSSSSSTEGSGGIAEKHQHGHHHLPTELSVSVILIAMALIGYYQEIPQLIIAAIFLHGIWDMAKHHCGYGVPFFGWYLNGCALLDVVYSAILVTLL